MNELHLVFNRNSISIPQTLTEYGYGFALIWNALFEGLNKTELNFKIL